MKLKKILVAMCIVISCGLLISCKPKENVSDNKILIEKETKMKLDFLVVPEQIIALNKGQLKEMDKLKGESKSENTKELTDILNSGKTIESKTLINIIFNKITDLEGDIIESVDMDSAIARFILNDDKETSYYESDHDLDSYSREITLLEDDYIIIPLLSNDKNKEDTEIEYVKTKIPNELISKLKKIIN